MAAVFAVAGSVTGWTTLPAAAWHDSAELASVAWRLSLSHSPGHPLHALSTRAVQFAPLGDGGFRANLASALCLAAALALLYRVLRRVAPGAGRLAAALAALLPVAMPAVWLQGARAEVYALQALLTVATGALCLRVAAGDDDRALPALALVFGLAGANHSYVGLMGIPLALWAMWVGFRGWRSVVGAVFAGTLGLMANLYLLLRARAGAEIGWGTPDSLAELWSTLSGEEWRRAMLPEAGTVDLADNLASLTAYLFDQLGALPSLVAFAVLLVAVPRWVRERRFLALALLAALCIPFASRVLYTVDRFNPDLGGYVVGALFAWTAMLLLALERWPRPAAVALGLLFALSLGRIDPGARRGTRTAERFARALLDEVPPGGALVVSDFNSAFLGWWLRAFEGSRPDVGVIFRGQVRRPWVGERLATQRPDLAAGLARFPLGYDGPDVRFEPGLRMDTLGEVERRLRPVGLTLAVDAEPGPVPRAPVEPGIDARRAWGFLHLVHAEHLLRLEGDWRNRVRAHLREADRLSPNDPAVAAVAARLRR